MKFNTSTFYFSHPCPIRHGTLPRESFKDKEIVDYFLKFKETQPNNDVAQHGWRTDSFIHMEHAEVLQELLDQIHLWYCNNICRPRGPEFIAQDIAHFTDTKDLVIDANIWFQESLPGQVCQQHDHGTLARFSWVYYLDVEKDPAPLTFVERKQVGDEIMNAGEQHLAVHNKMIVMFPSFIHHLVKPAMDKRYILAGNINDITFGVEDK